MSIFVTCECGQQFETLAANAGRRARCPDCGRALVVPVPKPAPFPEDAFETWVIARPAYSGKATASLALGLLFCFGCFSGVPAIVLGGLALSDIDVYKGRLRGRAMAIGGMVLGLIGCLITLAFVTQSQEDREASRRSQCANNLKQIALAVSSYHDANGCFPPAALTDRNGRPLLSWRVAILPYLEQGPLYARFHLDEPWDSPHNIALLDEEPRVYICPTDITLKRGLTGYQAFVGFNAAFTPSFQPLQYTDFPDGTSNTLLVGEADRGVPWTRPEDFSFDGKRLEPGLGAHHAHGRGVNAVRVDGSIRFLKASIAPAVLNALVTRNGAELITPNEW